MAIAKQQTKAAVTKISIKLESFSAGGVMPEGDYLLQKHEIVLWDYDGKMKANTLALRVTTVPFSMGSGKAEDVEPVVQHYSVGDPSAFGPDDEGTGIVALGSRTALGKGSNFFIYLENLVNSGFPEDKYDNDVSVFDGMVAHIAHIPAPERNLPKSNLVTTANPQQQRERTIPVVTAIHKLPWEKSVKKSAAQAPAAKAPAGKAPAKAAVQEEESAGPEMLLAEHLTTVLDGQGTMSRTQARVQVFKAMNAAGVDASERDAALKLFNDEEAIGNVLAGVGEGYTLEGTTITAVA